MRTLKRRVWNKSKAKYYAPAEGDGLRFKVVSKEIVMSEQIYELIPKVMKDIGAVSKDRRNEQQKYAFRGIEDFYAAAQPAYIAHGIFCAPKVLSRTEYRFEKTNDQGRVTSWLHVALEVEHRFFAPDGSFVPVTTWGEGLDNSDKATNKAMSGAMKYAVIELFSVPTKDVEDADRDSPETGTRQANGNAKVPVTEKPIPLMKGVNERIITPDEETLITSEQAEKLHTRFRDSIRPDLKKDADKFLYDFLGSKMFLDAHGNPSARMIPKQFFAATGKEAVAYAAGL